MTNETQIACIPSSESTVAVFCLQATVDDPIVVVNVTNVVVRQLRELLWDGIVIGLEEKGTKFIVL